jgi:hypothetical protein
MKAATGLVTCCLMNSGGLFLVGAADLADHEDAVGVGVVLEEP